MLRKLCVAVLLVLSCNNVKGNNTKVVNNRHPLLIKPYMELPLGCIEPKGWLKDQMNRMVTGMTGNLDILYPEVMSEKNGWLGGDGHAWERGPYWIDGLVPLAYIMDNDTLKAKAQKWIEWALASQQEDGFFGPYKGSRDLNDPSQFDVKDATRDWWPRMVMLKVFMQYYSATGDQRIIDVMTKYFKYQLNTLPEKPITYYDAYWAGARGGENLMAVYWLYNITGDSFLLDLAEIIHKQTFDWTNFLPDYKKMSTIFSLHTVNLAQGIKEPVIYYQQAKDQKYIESVEKGFDNIRHFLGWPTGLYAGDEHLHTNVPTQGSELCTAVEMMYSLEKMIEITGKSNWGDLLERIAFNALPTQTTDAFDARQYYQQCNQIEISRKVRNFQTNYAGTDQLFGLLTGYPCCTANLHQGWPKFTQHLWYATADKGLAAIVYSPCKVETYVGTDNVLVGIEEDTFYPFDENILMKIHLNDERFKEYRFSLHLRIPEWCRTATIELNGEKLSDYSGGQIIELDRKWKDGDKLQLIFPMRITTDTWCENSVSVERGPLVYALRIGEKWSKVKGSDSYGDYYEVYPTSSWNYGLIESEIDSSKINDNCKVIRKKVCDAYPWNLENAPIEIRIKAKEMYEWREYNGNAGPLPYSVNTFWGTDGKGPYGEIEEVILIPYGCSTLRITEFPVTK